MVANWTGGAVVSMERWKKMDKLGIYFGGTVERGLADGLDVRVRERENS